MLEKVSRIILLKDFYGPLLTARQQEILSFYYEQDLSLSEIGAEMGISRQAVFDLVKRAERLLEHYEDKLGLVERFSLYRQQLLELRELLKADTVEPQQLIAAQSLLKDLSALLL